MGGERWVLQNKLRNRSQIEFKVDEENVRVLKLHLLNIELTSSVKKAQNSIPC